MSAAGSYLTECRLANLIYGYAGTADRLYLNGRDLPDWSKLRFVYEGHRYFWDGERELPGVTSILKEAGLTPIYADGQRASLRGTATHLAILYHEQQELDPESLDPQVRPYFEAYLAFTNSGWIPRRPAILDFKTGSPASWHPLQTGAYAGCLPFQAQRFACYLRADGTFHLVTHADLGDFGVFLSALTLNAFKRNHPLTEVPCPPQN